MLCSRFSLLTGLIIVSSAILYFVCFSDITSLSFNGAKTLLRPVSRPGETTTALKIPAQSNVTMIDPPPVPSKPEILQLSMLFGAEKSDIYERCLKSHSEHGKRWAYETHVLRQAVRIQAYYLLNKPLYILSFLLTEMAKKADERAKWIVWFDADTIVMNTNIPWSTFLPPSDSYSHVHIVGNNDGGGFNAGVFLVRVCEWSVKVFADSLALPEIRSDIKLRPHNVEQDAMEWVFGRDEDHEHIVYTPQYWFNGYKGNTPRGVRDVEPGDMMRHFAGFGDRKPGMMRDVFDRLEHSPQELQVPLKDTYYTAEIDAFWSRLTDAKNAVQEAKAFMNDTSGMGDSAEEIEKARLELEENTKKHSGQVDLIDRSIGALLTALNSAKEAQSHKANDRK